MKGSFYGIKNLQRIVPNLMEWTKMPNEDYTGLSKIYNQVVGQYSRYMGHVAKYVGGIMETPKRVEEQGPVYEIVAETKQKEAVDFLNKQLGRPETYRYLQKKSTEILCKYFDKFGKAKFYRYYNYWRNYHNHHFRRREERCEERYYGTFSQPEG